MGDRSQVKFKQAAGAIWLYGHWAGPELAQTIQTAFKDVEGGRWNDEAYTTRFLIGKAIAEHVNDTTGFGISTERMDNEYNVLEVDFPAQKVRLLSREGYHDEKFDWDKNAKVLQVFTFKEFAALKQFHVSERDPQNPEQS